MSQLKTCPTCGASYDASHLFCPRDSAPLRFTGEAGELVGSLIAGRYLVSARIGVGGMGEVYRAQDVRLQRPIALKVLHASLSSDIDALTRFSREAGNCSKINNQHVVQVHDFGETEDGIAFIAMELVQGRSLKALLDAEGPLAPHRAVKFVSQIATGLDAAHRLECPVVHRDLKPENILVAPDPEGGEMLKVADFGISKAMRDDAQELTKTGWVAGTYQFMSPEQVTGGNVDQRSDVYTLALIAFLMLTGKLPFPAQTPEHSMLLRLNEAPKTLRAMRSDVHWPDAAQQVMNKALARDPGRRYDSAGEFARALALSLQPRQKEIASRRRLPGAIWAAAGIGALALIGGAVAIVGNRPSPRDTEIALLSGDTSIPEPAPTRTDTSPAVDTQPPPQDTSAQDSFPSSPPAGGRTNAGKAPGRTRTPPATSKPLVTPKPAREQQKTFPLENYESILHPGLQRDSALLTLASLDALMPRLTSVRDSVEADLYRAEAMALAGRSEEACTVLEQARPRATDRQRSKIELWVDQGICPAQQSSVSPRRSRIVTAESVRGIRMISNG